MYITNNIRMIVEIIIVAVVDVKNFDIVDIF